MILGKRVRLYPTEEQEQKFRQFGGAARYAYNFGLTKKQEYYEKGVTLNAKDIRHLLVSQREDNHWLKDIPEAVTKKAIDDLVAAYDKYFKGKSGKPKKHKKKNNFCSFYQRSDGLHLKEDKKDKKIIHNYIKITGIKKYVKCNPIDELPKHIYNTRVKYDGKYWYLTYSYDVEPQKQQLTNEIIGIDLGLKNTAILSNRIEYSNINKTERVKRIEKHIQDLQRKISHKYLVSKNVKTKNIIKLEKKVSLLYRRLSNIRDNYNHYITSEIVKTKPSKIVIEDLDIKGMMKDKSKSKAIQSQKWYDLRKKLTYKCEKNGIQLVVADKRYASSKLCSFCGHKKKVLGLDERVYKCEKCGKSIDRDYNAALNLRNYGIVE